MSEPSPLVEMHGATVRFGNEIALDGVDFRMYGGEVHSLMGENGAGKSTLIRALTGAHPLDEGSIHLDGAPVEMASPIDAQRHGIRTVYQELDLLPNLSVAENIMLGREPRRFGAIDWRRMQREAGEILSGLGLELDPASPLGVHSLAIQQLVAIARAISTDVRVLVLDEPTSSLDADEVAELFRVIRDLKDRGVAILFVSHFLDQVYEICDRVTVLRDGALVGEYLTGELLRIDLVQKMLGKDAADLIVRSRGMAELLAAAPVFEAHDLGRGPLQGVDLAIAEGDVLGFAGLLGSGRTELARALSGVDRPETSFILFRGKRLLLRTPRQAIATGIAYSSENRKSEGIIDQLTVRENITLALQSQRGIWRRISMARQRELTASWIEALGIRPTSPEAPAWTLSGGNQQKVLIARLLALSPRVLLLDEPTRGIDVGAKVEVQNLVGELADNGMSVIFISSELEEVLRVSSRITVLREGHVVATVPADELESSSLLAMVTQPDDDE